MGLEGSSLEFFGSHIGEIIFDDSAKAEDVVGTGNYRNEEIDHFVERVVFMITEDVEESFRNRSISLTNRYFQERRRQHIFTYTKTEHIPEACMVNGGIPGWTKKEDIFLKEF